MTRKLPYLVCFLLASLSFNFVFSQSNFSLSKPYKEPAYVKLADQIINSFCSYMLKKHKLLCIGSGGGFLHNVEDIFLHFSGEKYLSIEEARLLFIETTQELLKRINENEEIRPYLSHYPYTEKGLTILISLDKKNRDRVNPPFIALILTGKDKIYYEIYDKKNDKLCVKFQENYQTALQIVSREKTMKTILDQIKK